MMISMLNKRRLPHPGRRRGPKVARPRPGADSDKFSDEARSLVDRFFKGMQGQLYSPVKRAFAPSPPFPISSSLSIGPYI